MAWTCIYDDLAEFKSADGIKARNLPIDGIQGLIIDGEPYAGFEYCAFKGDKVFIGKDKSSFPPGATIIRGKTTSTRRFHEIEVRLGIWHPKNLKPDAIEPDWKKDVIGWRIWTSVNIFDSKGVAKVDWPAEWALLPDDIQIVMLYENWLTAGGAHYRQVIMGGDNFFIAPSAHGIIINTSDDTEVEIQSRYPGAIVKKGRQLSDNEFKVISNNAMAAKFF